MSPPMYPAILLSTLLAGLPLSAWLMMLVAGGLGLAIELVFYLRHRDRG